MKTSRGEIFKKRSLKRDSILELLRSTDTHPTADWIYSSLKPRYHNLSLATVYRSLSAFRENGYISSVGVVRGTERFDSNTTPHAHFICEACGSVSDLLAFTVPDETHISLLSAMGYKVSSCGVTYSGVCADCARLEDEAKEPGTYLDTKNT